MSPLSLCDSPSFFSYVRHAIAALLAGGAMLWLGMTTGFVSWREAAYQETLQHVPKTTSPEGDALGVYARGLDGLYRYFAAEQTVSRSGFSAFVGAGDFSRDFPGAAGLGFARRIKRSEFDLLRRQLGDLDLETIGIRTRGRHDDLFITKYFEPLKGNRSFLGLDLGSDPFIRRAAEESAHRGEPVVTERAVLLGDETGRPMRLLLRAVYRGSPISLEEHRAALLGWVFVPFAHREPAVAVAETGQPNLQAPSQIPDPLDSGLLHREFPWLLIGAAFLTLLITRYRAGRIDDWEETAARRSEEKSLGDPSITDAEREYLVQLSESAERIISVSSDIQSTSAASASPEVPVPDGEDAAAIQMIREKELENDADKEAA